MKYIIWNVRPGHALPTILAAGRRTFLRPLQQSLRVRHTSQLRAVSPPHPPAKHCCGHAPRLSKQLGETVLQGQRSSCACFIRAHVGSSTNVVGVKTAANKQCHRSDGRTRRLRGRTNQCGSDVVVVQFTMSLNETSGQVARFF